MENGGTLLMSFFNDIVDENEHIHMGSYPAPFRDMLGIVVEEYAPYTETQTNTIRAKDGNQFQCTFWSDVIHLKGADSIADFAEDYYAGYPAITHDIFGKGRAYYVGTVLEQSGMQWLTEYVCHSAGVQSVAAIAPAGVEILQRTNGKTRFLFVLNHSNEKVNVTVEGQGCDLLTGVDVNNSVELEPCEAAIIQMK